MSRGHVVTHMNALPITAFPSPSPRTRKKRAVTLRPHHKARTQQIIAGVAAGFLPVASYVIAHVEAPKQPALYALVACALAYSAPTLAHWANKWAGETGKPPVKAWGFTVLLEGVMVFSHLPALSLTGLAILVSINAVTAFHRAAKI